MFESPNLQQKNMKIFGYIQLCFSSSYLRNVPFFFSIWLPCLCCNYHKHMAVLPFLRQKKSESSIVSSESSDLKDKDGSRCFVASKALLVLFEPWRILVGALAPTPLIFFQLKRIENHLPSTSLSLGSSR